MNQTQHSKVYNLEDRTYEFARQVRLFIKLLPRTLGNLEDGKQLIRSSGSVGANYIEANESLSKKDFRLRIKISRKEAKESRYWLRLIDVRDNTQMEEKRQTLVQEATELLSILSAILNKTS